MSTCRRYARSSQPCFKLTSPTWPSYVGVVHIPGRVHGASPMRPLAILLTLTLLPALIGCKPENTPIEARPVRTLVVDPKPIGDGRQAIGEVRPRYESDLSFRVAGKVLARRVDVGASVRQGDILATLDTQDFRIAFVRSKLKSHLPTPCSSKPGVMRRARRNSCRTAGRQGLPTTRRCAICVPPRPGSLLPRPIST